MIVKEKDKYVVYSHDKSKRLSKPYSSKKEAVKRLQQIEYFKHIKATNASKKFGNIKQYNNILGEDKMNVQNVLSEIKKQQPVINEETNFATFITKFTNNVLVLANHAKIFAVKKDETGKISAECEKIIDACNNIKSFIED